MCFCTVRVIRNAPRRCTASTVSQSSSVILNSRLSRITPALFTSTVGAPRPLATRPTAASTWSRLLTSAATASARPPASVISLTVPAQEASSRSSTPTAIPSAARRRAVAAPMPRAAPVTMATRCSCDIRTPFVRFAWSPGPGGWLPRRRLPCGAVRSELTAGQRALVHLVGPVGEPQGPRAGPQMREREVLADPGRAVRLDRLVDHPLGHRWGHDLDGLDLGVRALVAHRVHQPRGLQHQQPRLLDPHPRLGDPVPDDALVGKRPAERDPAGDPAAHQLKGPLGSAA